MVQDNINILQDNFDLIQNVAGNFDPNILDKIAGMNPMDFDPSNMNLEDISQIMEKGQKGVDMVKDVHSKIEDLNNPFLNEAVNKVKNHELIGKMKDVDLGELQDKIKNFGSQMDDTKKKVEGLMNFFN